MRLVLDTNVLISGLWTQGTPPGQLLARWRNAAFVLITSQEQVAELESVLARPKIIKRIAPAIATRLLADLRSSAIWVSDFPEVELSPDPDDNRILATAIAGRVDLIVSGDRRGMRDLRVAAGIRIVSAREAVVELGAGD